MENLAPLDDVGDANMTESSAKEEQWTKVAKKLAENQAIAMFEAALVLRTTSRR